MGPISYSVSLHKAGNAAIEKNSSLEDPFISYEEKNVLWKQHQGLYSSQFIFFVTYKWDSNLDCLSLASPSSLVKYS
jgi:hypothetical protein